MTRVLYVDDEADIREVAAMSLELDPGFDVRTCASASEMLALVPEWRPDLILLDVMMPVTDGPTAFARLREMAFEPPIPVVFITARTQAQDVEALKTLGARGVIPKPFDPLRLATEARAFLE